MISARSTASVFMALFLLETVGCGSNSSGGGSPAGGGSGGSSAPAAASASGPTGKIAMCSVFSAVALSAASGKSFGETIETDTGDGVYGCVYNLASDAGTWVLDVREPSDGDDPTTDGLDLGGASAVKPVTGTGYTTVASKAGVQLQVGKDVVEVYTPSTAPEAQATTAQFVTVAKAVIAALSK